MILCDFCSRYSVRTGSQAGPEYHARRPRKDEHQCSRGFKHDPPIRTCYMDANEVNGRVGSPTFYRCPFCKVRFVMEGGVSLPIPKKKKQLELFLRLKQREALPNLGPQASWTELGCWRSIVLVTTCFYPLSFMFSYHAKQVHCFRNL